MTKREMQLGMISVDASVTSLVTALVGDLADRRNIGQGVKLRLRELAELVQAPWPAEG